MSFSAPMCLGFELSDCVFVCVCGVCVSVCLCFCIKSKLRFVSAHLICGVSCRSSGARPASRSVRDDPTQGGEHHSGGSTQSAAHRHLLLVAGQQHGGMPHTQPKETNISILLQRRPNIVGLKSRKTHTQHHGSQICQFITFS